MVKNTLSEQPIFPKVMAVTPVSVKMTEVIGVQRQSAIKVCNKLLKYNLENNYMKIINGILVHCIGTASV